MSYFESPIFYMGNKYKLLRQLLPLFPEKCDTFYDLFGGSGVVSMNYKGQSGTVYNELNPHIVGMVRMIMASDITELDRYYSNKVRMYGLRARSNKADPLANSEGYYKLRDDYNRTPHSVRNPKDLFLLSCYSINHIIRFNSEGQFNVSNGSDCYGEWMPYKMRAMQRLLKGVEIWNSNVFDIDTSIFRKGDFVYYDPPYSSTTAVYNEKRAFGGWDVDSDMRLFGILDDMTQRGISWGLSNVFTCREKENRHLMEWCGGNDLTVVHLDRNYNPLSKGNSNSDEVYICNYRPGNLTTSLF